MPLDPVSGVHYRLQGQGRPLLVGLPLFASMEAIFGTETLPVLQGYLDRLTDRYRVLLVDYPSIGGSRDIPPAELTADRVCADLLHVADAAGFDRFAYWGYSWGGSVGVQLAHRSDRLTALVVGGWPVLGAPVAAMLQATRLKQANPEPSSMKVLRSAAQYAQWEHYYASIAGGTGAGADADAEAGAGAEAEAIARIACPRMAFFGADGDLVEAGIPVNIASQMRLHRATLQAQGWRVHEVPGHGHAVCMQPQLVVPPVRAFLDHALP